MAVSRTNHLWENRKVLFNLEEQVITKILVVKVIIYIRNQTSTSSTDLPKNGSRQMQLPHVWSVHTGVSVLLLLRTVQQQED